MGTEIRHGEKPKWSRPVTGMFFVMVEGHYTDEDGVGAAGVRAFRFESDRRPKCQAELLVLRTAFKDWAENAMRTLGGDVEGMWL